MLTQRRPRDREARADLAARQRAMSAGPLALWIDDCTPAEEEHVGKVFFEFETNDLAAARSRLEEQGAKVGMETKGPDFTGFMVQDPFGMRFHVFAKARV